MKILDKAANVAIILAVTVFLGLALRGQIGLPGHHHQETTLVGSHLKGVPTSSDRDSLIFVISTSCHFCKESLSFYKRLTEQSHGRVDFVAVVPQSEQEARLFLESAGIGASRIVSAMPDSLGVTGTPALLLVGKGGKVKNTWLGKLDEKGEKDVAEHLANPA